MKNEIKLHVALEQTVPVPKRLRVLFQGLKMNHMRRANLVYPIFSLLRLTLFAVILVTTPERPFGLFLMMLSTLATLCYTILERQWRNPSSNTQQIANEATLYILCGIMVYFCSVDTDS